jgi:hypothetical protein
MAYPPGNLAPLKNGAWLVLGFDNGGSRAIVTMFNSLRVQQVRKEGVKEVCKVPVNEARFE